jgi:hypothetical protein
VIEQFTAFRASDSTVHDSPWAAWKRELFIWLRAHGVDNDAIAATIVKRVDEGRPATLEALSEIVAGLVATAPPPPPEPARSLDRCGDPIPFPPASKGESHG